MKAKLIVKGKEFDIEINDPELVKLVKPPKKTGYERVDEHQAYYCVCGDGDITMHEEGHSYSDVFYNKGNYYSDKTVAENNARADRLMRQLRRFAVEHREKDLDWKNSSLRKYTIEYDHNIEAIKVHDYRYIPPFGAVWFDSEDAVELAIKTFHDELIWYFTEYKDSL